jgi:tRNA(Ile)-lysidine synthase
VKEPLVKVVKDFIDSFLEGKVKFVVAFSGGVDSSALLSLLVECRSFFDFDLHVAHFDHGWRKESKEQALFLRKQVEALGLPFHSERSSAYASCNKEDKAREERFDFFKRVYGKVGGDAVFLAHQREDQAETVLKRVLEGAGLTSLQGMEPVSCFQGMLLARPLLGTPRKELVNWNKHKGALFIEDYTNYDLQFLRPRIREKLFPYLEKWFGKGVQKNLCSIGEEFALLKRLLRKRIDPFLAKRIEGPLGLFFPLAEVEEEIERREIVRILLKEKGVFVGRTALKEIEKLQDVSDKRVDVSLGDVVMRSGDFFWFPFTSAPIWGENSKEWVWEEKKVKEAPLHESLLSSFLKGEVYYNLPIEGNARFCSYNQLSAKEKKNISSFFSRNKVPARIRKSFPLVLEDEGVIEGCFLFNLKSKAIEFNNVVRINLKKSQN